jgi:hypothetical protein
MCLLQHLDITSLPAPTFVKQTCHLACIACDHHARIALTHTMMPMMMNETHSLAVVRAPPSSAHTALPSLPGLGRRRLGLALDFLFSAAPLPGQVAASTSAVPGSAECVTIHSGCKASLAPVGPAIHRHLCWQHRSGRNLPGAAQGKGGHQQCMF